MRHIHKTKIIKRVPTYIFIIYVYFFIISENEEHVINALEDGDISIFCENYNNAELNIQNAEVFDEINESM